MDNSAVQEAAYVDYLKDKEDKNLMMKFHDAPSCLKTDDDLSKLVESIKGPSLFKEGILENEVKRLREIVKNNAMELDILKARVDSLETKMLHGTIHSYGYGR